MAGGKSVNTHADEGKKCEVGLWNEIGNQSLLQLLLLWLLLQSLLRSEVK